MIHGKRSALTAQLLQLQDGTSGRFKGLTLSPEIRPNIATKSYLLYRNDLYEYLEELLKRNLDDYVRFPVTPLADDAFTGKLIWTSI